MSWCEAALNAAVESIALPLESSDVDPRAELPSLNMTVPVGVPPLPVTVAVSWTVFPYVEAPAGLANRVVVVAARFAPQLGNLNVARRVLQLKEPLDGMY